jgi:hypothetical protein
MHRDQCSAGQRNVRHARHASTACRGSRRLPIVVGVDSLHRHISERLANLGKQSATPLQPQAPSNIRGGSSRPIGTGRHWLMAAATAEHCASTGIRWRTLGCQFLPLASTGYHWIFFLPSLHWLPLEFVKPHRTSMEMLSTHWQTL